MPIRVDDEKFEQSARVAGVAIAAYTMRAMEKWRVRLADYDSAMIMVAVVAISAERLLRAELPTEYRALAVPIDPALLGKVNVAGIAAATGLNRETTRRKVSQLVEQGMLTRLDDGGIAPRPSLMQEEWIREQLRGQLGEIAGIVNQLVRIGVLAED